jgi:two-component system response regulator AtoC
MGGQRFNPQYLVASLSKLPLEEHEWGFGNILGRSEKMRHVFKTLKKIASAPAVPVIIKGASGTGKELVSRAIHNASPSVHYPFVQINCSALPESLLESEIFGYEKGAFTDAKATKRGLLEIADNGTFFLDEIANMSLNLQAKLLTAIEQKRFKRVGGTEDIQVRTRIIAATNKKIEEEVTAGLFREDLYYRLNVISITLPPLRERGNDILLLANYFLSLFNKEHQRHVGGFSEEAIEMMLNYPWPGNVRELKNTVERVVVLEQPDIILPHHLDLGRGHIIKQPSIHYPKGGDNVKVDIPPHGISLEEVEQAFIIKALAKTNGNQVRAAELLGLTRQTLRYRMKKYNITPT